MNRLTRSGFCADQLLRGEVHGDGQVGRRVDVAGRDLAAALAGDRRLLERLDDEDGVDPAGLQRAGCSGNGSSVNLTAAGSPPSFLTDARTLVSTMFFSVLAATVLPARSLGDLIGLSALTNRPAKSLSSTAGRVVAVGDHLQRRPLALAEQQRDGVAEAELVLTAEHGRHDRRTALRGVQREVDVALAEEALLLAEVDRRDVDDRDDADVDLVGPSPDPLLSDEPDETAGRDGHQSGDDRETGDDATHESSQGIRRGSVRDPAALVVM